MIDSIDITQKTNPEIAYVVGRNGLIKLGALHIWLGSTSDNVYIDGKNRQGMTINGGFMMDLNSFNALCVQLVNLTVAGTQGRPVVQSIDKL